MAVRFLPVHSSPDEAPESEHAAVAEVIELRTQLTSVAPERAEQPETPVFDRAVRLLARRALSEFELAAQLRQEGYAAESIQEAIVGCVTRRYLDDSALAEQLTRRLRTHKKLGKNAIRAQLLTRRIDPNVIEAVLREMDEDEEYEALLSLARAKARTLRHLERTVAERRLSGYLARRGYAGASLRQVTKLALDEVARGM